jgi:hypothetical protein
VRSPWHEAPRRRAQWFALIAVVTLAHVGVGVEVVASVIGWEGGMPPPPRRIDVDLVQELAPTEAPPEALAPPEPVAQPALAVRPHRAASAPVAAPVAVAEAEAASPPEAAASAAEAAGAAASAASGPETPAAGPMVALQFGGGAVSGPPGVAVASSDLGGLGAAPPVPPAASSPASGTSGAAGAASAPQPSGTGRFEWPPSRGSASRSAVTTAATCTAPRRSSGGATARTTRSRSPPTC